MKDNERVEDFEIINTSWGRVSEAIGDLANCFHEKLPESRVEYASSSVFLQISRYMNSIMSYLDKTDKNHSNFDKSRCTAFNLSDVYNDHVSINRYNSHQIELLQRIRQACIVEVSFRKDEASGFANTSQERANKVIGALKSTKLLNLKSQKDDRYTISLCPFRQYKIRKCGLTEDELNTLGNYITKQGSATRNILKTIFSLRNEEQHNRPIKVRISEERYFQVGEPGSTGHLIEALPGSKINLRNTTIFLSPVTDHFLAQKQLEKLGIGIGEWLHFDYETIPYGYRELLIPSSRLRVSGTGTLNVGMAAISMTTNCCLMLSVESEINLQNVTFIFASGNMRRISGELNQIHNNLPLMHKTVPVITVSGEEGRVDLREVVRWGEALKEVAVNHIRKIK